MRSAGGAWQVRLWSCIRGVAPVQIGKRAMFPTPAEAVAWACEILRQHGTIVFVNGREQSLLSFLVFHSAPVAVETGR